MTFLDISVKKNVNSKLSKISRAKRSLWNIL